MSDEVIRDLCLMYGAGYTGKVHIMYNAGSQITDLDQFALLSVLNAAKKGTLDHVKIPQRPFSDMLIKDEKGVCDAERLYPLVLGAMSHSTGDDEWIDFYSTIRQNKQDRAGTIHFDGKIEGDEMDAIEITKFMHEHGYWIPKTLKEAKP